MVKLMEPPSSDVTMAEADVAAGIAESELNCPKITKVTNEDRIPSVVNADCGNSNGLAKPSNGKREKEANPSEIVGLISGSNGNYETLEATGNPVATATTVTVTSAKAVTTATTVVTSSATCSSTTNSTSIKYFINGNNEWLSVTPATGAMAGTGGLVVGNFNTQSQFAPPPHTHHHSHVPPPPVHPRPHIFNAIPPTVTIGNIGNGGGSSNMTVAGGKTSGSVNTGNSNCNTNHRGHSPNRPGRYTPSPQSRGSSPNQGPAGGAPPTAPTGSLPGTNASVGTAQHVVHLHVNPGEAISFQMGDQMQLIQGPATVRMVSNNTSPPIPMPVQVPPGHMVQQIVDENGTLRHVILSPQPPMTVPMGPTYAPGPGPNTGPASPHFYNPYPHHPPPYTHHPHPSYHPAAGPPPPHMQPGVTHPIHGQVSPLSHQCNSHHPHQGQSPPPVPHHIHSKDERAQRQMIKLKKKLEARQQRDNATISSHCTPPISPKKENNIRKYKDRNTSTSGLEENEENVLQDEEDTRILTELLSKVLPPKVSEIKARSALTCWEPPDMSSENGENKYNEFDIPESDFVYDVLLSDRGKDGKFKVVYSGNALEYVLTDLKPATEYHICLQAVLDELRGNPTETILFKTESCEPDAPQPPKVSNRTKTSLLLRWNAAADNGSRITSYVLEYDEGKGTGQYVEVFKGLQKQFKLIKLAASTSYRFRLFAINDIGRSKPSETVCYQTSGSTPSQPNPPQLKEASVTRLHLFWLRRPNDDDFTLQMEHEASGHGFLPVYNGKEVSYLCYDLQRNTEYKFRLCANNEEGPSRWSDVVSYRTLPDRPSVPSKPLPKGRIHSSNFKISWDPPRDNGGSDIQQYIVEMDSGNGFEAIYSGLNREFTCDHLLPGNQYKLRASCITVGGLSEYSEVSTITTLPVCPGQCSSPRLHGKPRATTLNLKWAYPDTDGGSPVAEFEIDMTSPDNTTRQAYRGRDTDCTVAGLLPGRPYLFQVRAINKIGVGLWSEPLEVVSGAGAPDRPKEPRVMFKSPHHALVTWEEPVNNGATITEFRVEWSIKDDEFSSLFQGPGLNYEVKGLTPATLYNFRVMAINSAGVSPVSSVSSCTTPPSSPGSMTTSSIKAVSTATTIQLSWKEPSTHGSDIVSYNIDLGERHSLIAVGNVPEWVIEDLLPETTYRIRIQAVNSVGVGPFSSTVKVTTLSLPPAPPRLECVGANHNSLKLKWGEGKNSDFTQYTLEIENKTGRLPTPSFVDVNSTTWVEVTFLTGYNSTTPMSMNLRFVQVYQGPFLSHKVTKLSEMTTYRFRIFATNDAGDGPCSEVNSYTTSKAPPPTLKAPRVFDVTESSCSIEWQAAKPVGEDAIIYQLQLLNARDQECRLVYRGSNLVYHLTGLDPKTEYSARVGTVRLCRDGLGGDLVGAFSSSTSFNTPNREPVRTTHAKPLSSPVLERRPLTDQQWAVIILCSFTIVSVLLAMVIQQLLAYSKTSSPPSS